MKTKENKLAQIFMYFAIFICSLLAMIFLINNNIILFLMAFGVCTFISINKKIKYFPIILFITSVLIRVIAILILNFPQLTDFSILLDAKFLNFRISIEGFCYLQNDLNIF